MIESVLVERHGMGRTEQFVPIAVAGHGAGALVGVRVTGLGEDGLIGEAIRDAA
jgi:threonylcarbamoyladenosine tRNA methylthiotransferase MtaB